MLDTKNNKGYYISGILLLQSKTRIHFCIYSFCSVNKKVTKEATGGYAIYSRNTPSPLKTSEQQSCNSFSSVP